MNGWAWIVDIDGTLALKGARSPYDWGRVGEDKPNAPVIRVVQALMTATYQAPGDTIIYLSGRMEQCREATRAWLHEHVCGSVLTCSCDAPLFMRPDDDCRPDEVLKRELYETHIAPKFDVLGVIDDRAKVVRVWREMGLTCLAVAEGDF